MKFNDVRKLDKTKIYLTRGEGGELLGAVVSRQS